MANELNATVDTQNVITGPDALTGGDRNYWVVGGGLPGCGLRPDGAVDGF